MPINKINNLTFRKAINKEYLECFKILEKRLEWMNEKGIKHWNTFPYLEIFPLAHFKRLQDDEKLYVLLNNDEIVCFGALLESDVFWSEARKEDAFYLHHFTSVVNDLNYGKHFLLKCFDLARSMNKTYFRLDYKKDFKPLEKYYGEFGFIKVGEYKDEEYTAILCELKLNDKKSLRNKIKTINLDEEYIKNSSLLIQNKIIQSDEYKKAEDIFIYISTSKEVMTNKVIEDALKNNKRVYVPKIEDKQMKAILINSNSKLIKNKYDILEPLDGLEAKNIDLAIIPCLSANFSLRRLGHGGGYYDRFLENVECLKWVLCFKKRELLDIPMDKYDIYMDKLINEES